MRTASTQSGFTLTELIMVIVILGALSVVALPMWFSKSDFQARGYFDELLQATRYAQKVAVTSNCEVQITITSSAFSLQILGSPYPHCASTDLSLPGKGGPYPAPSDVTIGGTGTITFLPYGKAASSQTVTVGDHSMRIHADTGYVERL